MQPTHQPTRTSCPAGFQPSSRDRLAEWCKRVDQLLSTSDKAGR